MKPIQQHKDPRITNISFDNFTGSIYIIDPNLNDENQSESMLTSPRTNGADNFVPSHHLALITQPVLGARSRSRKKTTGETSTKDKIDSMTNSRRSSYNDSPPLILPINRIDTSQFQKKTNSNSHHESSDSGLDLSLSTNSSVQLQQYPQQHIPIHRPLSALNEDSSPDDGYHDEHQQAPLNAVRLRFPPVSLGRNHSMEDIINNNTREQQHRSSSFSDEKQQKLSLQQEQKMKRTSDGALLDLLNSSPQSTELYRQTNHINKNDFFYPPITQPHRSLNDLTNKTSNKVLSVRNESNTSSVMNNLPTTHTIIRKPNTSTLKPLRKKTKLNIIVEPSIPLTSTRLAVYDEQINGMTRTTSSSSNQTTPRSIRPPGQQQIKSKTSTPLGHYANQEQMRAQVNRSVVERQYPSSLPPPPPPRRVVIQQMIPFDASPSKINNLLLRHHVQQNQPAILFHPSSTLQLSPSRQIKQTLPTLYNEETISNVQEEKRKQIKSKEQDEKKCLKEKDEFENNKSNEIHQKEQGKIKIQDIQESIPSKSTHKRQNSQDQFEQTNLQRQFINANQKQQEKELSFERNLKKKIEKNRLVEEDEFIYRTTPLRQYEQNDIGEIYRDHNRQQRRTNINDRYGSGHSNSTTGKPYDNNNINRRQQRNIDPSHIYRSDGINGEQRMQKSKPIGVALRNKTQNHSNDKSPSRMSETSNHYGSDYSYSTQKATPVGLHTRPSKINFQTFETPTTRHSSIQSQIDQNQHSNQWQKSQVRSQQKPVRMEPINPNLYDSRRERETSRLSNISKTDSIPFDDKQVKQRMIKKNSTGQFPPKSPTSWSVISEHQNYQQQLEIDQKTSKYQSELSITPSPHEELIEDNGSTSSRTYRLITDDQQQSMDGRHVIPSNNLQVPSMIDQSFHTSSRHTYPFTYTPDVETNDDTLIDNSSRSIENKKQKSIPLEDYTSSDHDNLQNTIDHRNSPSPLVHFSSNKKFSTSSPSPPTTTKKLTISTAKDEIVSNYDSDDGWSDDSAELLYIDERYATEKRKITPSSHLPLQQHYHYHLQQQNVLLQ